MVTPGFVVRKIIGILGAYFGITKSGNNVSIVPPNGGTISIPGLTVAATAPFQVTDGGSTVYCQVGTAGVEVQSADQFSFSTSSTDASASPDTGLARNAAGQVNITNGSTTTYLQLGVNTGVNSLVKCVNPTATTGASVAGRSLTIESGDAVASTDTAGAAAGGDLNFNAGDAARFTSGNGNGGNIVFTTGALIGSGTNGAFTISAPTVAGPVFALKDSGGNTYAGLNANGNWYIRNSVTVGTNDSGSTYAGSWNSSTLEVAKQTAIPAGGTAGTGVRLSSATNFGAFFGSGAPTLQAAKGSLYLRSDGSGINDRMYVNTDGSTTWTAVVTVA